MIFQASKYRDHRSGLGVYSELGLLRKSFGYFFSVKNVIASIFFLAQFIVFSGAAMATLVTQIASGLTAPNSGVILSGTAVNPATGLPYRHLWIPDHLAGVCRMDPDLDSGAATYTLNRSTCISFVPGGALKPGQVSYDPITNNLYVVDLSVKSQGIFRLHYLPNGDSGHGLLNSLQIEVIGSLSSGCSIGGNIPYSANLGPDGNLYIGFKRSGNLIRVVNPAVDPVPCGNFQLFGTTPDQKKNVGLGWIGRDLYGADGLSPWVIRNADQCLTPANGNTSCRGTSVFVGRVPVPSAVISDQVYPATNGSTLYIGNANAVARASVTPVPFVETNYISGMSFVMGLAIDMSNPANPFLYIADDPTNGLGVNAGRLWKVTNPPPAPAAPGVPIGLTGSAGDQSVTLNWTAGSQGSQPITSYTITPTIVQGGPAPAPTATTVFLTAPALTAPTTANITGLVNGVGYSFTVLASNSVGLSAPSSPSAVFTPVAASAPSAPTNVSAIGGNGTAAIAWTAPASSGGSTITSYTVSSFSTSTGAIIPAPSSVAFDVTGTVINGLTNGATYTFTVTALNAVGSSVASTPSNPVTLSSASGPPDMSMAMSGPPLVNFGADAVYLLTVVNNGPSGAVQAIVTDTIPATGATFKSATPSQGSCAAPSGSIITCNLGAIPAGSSATIAVTLNVTAKITNAAQVQANDSAGVVLSDPNPGNNNANVITGIAVPITTTDLQVTGVASVGGPAVGSSDSFTWQIRNAGRQAANAVIFTNDVPNTLSFVAVSSSLGSCIGPNPGSLGGKITCSLSSLLVGQSMQVTTQVKVPTSGSISTIGAVNFSGTDTNPLNNSATVTIQAK